jgi:hypothetical protein
VLYDRINLGQNQEDVVARLRRHAEARDWVIVAEVIEYGPPETTSPAGQGWQTVRRLVGNRRAMGIVTTSRQTLASVDGLDEWLREQRTFVSETAPAAAGGRAVTAGTPMPPVPAYERTQQERARLHAAQRWLAEAATDPEVADREWTQQGVALLTAGVTWDAVRAPYKALGPGLDHETTSDVLRRLLHDLRLSGLAFCDPYRPALYFLVPPGTDRRWPADLAPQEVECLGGTAPYIYHLGVSRVDRVAPPGPHWLMPPNGGDGQVEPELLYRTLRARTSEMRQVGQ